MRPLIAIGLSCFLIAAEPAPVLAELVIPNGVALAAAWDASPYGVVWNAPALASVRQRLATSRATMVAEIGLDPLIVLAQSGTIQLALVGPDLSGDQPPWVLTIAAGTSTEAWFTALAAKGTINADGSATLESDWILRREGSRLVLCSRPDVAKPAEPAADRTHHLTMRVDGPALTKAMIASKITKGDARPADVAMVQRCFASILAGTADLTPTGLTLDGTATPAPAGMAALDRAALDRLPTTALEVAAIGINGKRLWSEVIAPIVERARLDGTNPEAGLKEFGIDLPLAEVVNGLGGTWSLAVGQGMPIPTMTIFSPSSPAIDQFAKAMLTKAGVGVPEAGTDAMIPLPMPVPVSLTIAHDARGWILTTDPSGAAALLAGTGWLTSPLGTVAAAKLTPTTCGLSVCDTKAQLRMIGSLMGIGVASAKDLTPQEKQAILAIPGQLAAKATPGWWTITDDGKQWHVASEGLGIGFTSSSLPVMAGMLLPAITMVRTSARRTNSSNNMRQIGLAAMVYCNDNDDQWPTDLVMVKEFAGGDLPDKIFRSSGDPTHPAPYLYIRPSTMLKANQPVLIEDPACWKGKGCNVVYADGHVKWHDKADAPILWAEGRRLAALPYAVTTGITWDDWSAMHALIKASHEPQGKTGALPPAAP